jgi:5-hydroxyisourate hydrolase
MGKLSTHVLDTVSGTPAAGIRIDLLEGSGEAPRQILSVTANHDGRTDEPLLQGNGMGRGVYRLVFHVGEYYRVRGHMDAGRFFELVPVEFVIDDPEGNYHVALLVSPWSYTTYRGS